MASDKPKYLHVVDYAAFEMWAEGKGVGINAFDKDRNLFGFDLTPAEAREFAAQLCQAADKADAIQRQLEQDMQAA